MSPTLRPRWVATVAGAFALVAAILLIEHKTSWLALTVGRDWATRDRFPCPGLTGALTAIPLFSAMGERLDRAPPESVVMLGDSTFTSSPGCGQGELPADETFQYRLKSELSGRDVANFGLWAADWPVLSRQTALLRLVQQTAPAPRTWVVLTSFPQPAAHLHPVLFAQLCHHPTCDHVCRELCLEEAESRSGGLWPFFRYLPGLANASAGLASFVQTFVTVAPLTARPVAAAGSLGWRTLASEREVTGLYERELVAYRDPARASRWKREEFGQFPRMIEHLRAAWSEGGLLQLWYKEWMRQLRGLNGQVVFVSQMPDPDGMATTSPEDRRFLQEIRDWLDSESLRAIPSAKLVKLELPGDAYYDIIHWTPAGTTAAAHQVALALQGAQPPRKEAR